MRKYGWYADTWAELAMNVGTWLLFLALGMLFGNVFGTRTAFYLFIAGGIVGAAGQMAWSNGESGGPGRGRRADRGGRL